MGVAKVNKVTKITYFGVIWVELLMISGLFIVDIFHDIFHDISEGENGSCQNYCEKIATVPLASAGYTRRGSWAAFRGHRQPRSRSGKKLPVRSELLQFQRYVAKHRC